MNIATRKTRACTLETLDVGLRSAVHAHALTFGLTDIEADVLMCCETLTVHQKKGFLGGLRTTLSAVYVTPKWLVWAESCGPDDAVAGTALLRQVDVHDYRETTQYAITPEQGLNVTGRYTDKNNTGITFIVLDMEVYGRKFRHVLDKALRSAAL